MNKLLTIALCSLVSLTCLTQCRKEDQSKTFNANFYTSTAGAKMSLFIDGEYKGELPYMTAAPECGASYGDGAGPLTFTLKSGTYKLTGKNAQGQVLSESVMRISERKKGLSGGKGGSSMNCKDECLAVGLFE